MSLHLRFLGIGIQGPGLPGVVRELQQGFPFALAAGRRPNVTLYAPLPPRATQVWSTAESPRQDVLLEFSILPTVGRIKFVLTGPLIEQIVAALRQDATNDFENIGKILWPIHEYLQTLAVGQ